MTAPRSCEVLIRPEVSVAIQQWTVMKLGGPAAGDAATRFGRWWRARARAAFERSDRLLAGRLIGRAAGK